MRAHGHKLTEREQVVLARVIRSFIATGRPVSSKAVLEGAPLGIGSATVRGVMASLERHGLLCQPHTSAGRVPTVQAMRHYVARLMRREPLAAPTLAAIRNQLGGERRVDGLLHSTSALLSHVSSFAGLVSPPSEAVVRLSHLELMPLGQGRVLVIVVTEGDQVQHHVVELGDVLLGADLVRMQNFLNETVLGLTMAQARSRLRDEVRTEKIRYDDMMRQAVEVAQRALAEAREDVALFIEGELNFLDLEDFGDVEQARRVLQALKDKRRLLAILDKLDDGLGSQILFGPLAEGAQVPGEGAALDGARCALILAPYRRREALVGWIGVVGPLRMPYHRLLPLVEATAGALSERVEEAMTS